MAVLRIVSFGGIMPSVNPRALPPAAASTAFNLHPNTAEFRPVLGSVTYSGAIGANNPATIYRMERDGTGELNTTPSSNWLAYAGSRSFARWPSAADKTERTTMSRMDGSSPPRVIDAVGTNRPLGVPAPVDPPTLTLNEGDYYLEAERNRDKKRLRALVMRQFKLHLDRCKIGMPYTDNLTEGYLESGPRLASGTPLDGPSPLRSRVYRYTAKNGTITDSYTDTPADEVAWVRRTRRGTWYQRTSGDPAWMGSVGQWHYKLDYHAYGIGYKLDDEADLAADLDAIEFLDTDQAEDIAAVIAELFDAGSKPAQAVLVPLKESVRKLESAINQLPPGSSTPAEIAAAQAAALDALALEIWKAIDANARTESVGAGA